MRKTVDLMFQLVKSELCGTPLAAEPFSALDTAAFEKLYTLAKAHDLVYLIGHGLVKRGILTKSSPMYGPFYRRYMMEAYRSENIIHDLSLLREALEEGKIPFLPLKGSVLRPFYPDPFMRTSSDIDILVREEDLDRTVAYLKERLSYETDGKRGYHDVHLTSKGGVTLELHFCLKEHDELLDRLLLRVWDYAAPLGEGRFEYAMRPAYFVYHIVAHMAHHFSVGGCGIRPLIDLYICKTRFTYEETELRAYLAESELIPFYEAASSAVAYLFEGTPLSPTPASMLRFILRGGVYGTQKNQMSAAGCNSKKTKRQYIRSRIFMPYGQLATRYPILQKHPVLTPFYEVRRWCATLFSGRMKHAKQELDTVKSIRKEESDEAVSLMRDLGLSRK